MTNAHTFKKSLSAESPRWHKLFPWVAALFFFLLPLQTRYFLREVPLYEWGTLSVFLVEVLGWLVVTFGLLLMRGLRIKDLRFRWWLVGLMAWAFLSSIWAPDKAVAAQGAVRLVEGILLYIVISTAAKRSREISRDANVRGVRSLDSLWSLGMTKWWMWAFLAGATIQAGLGIYQFLTQSSFASTLLGMALHDPRELGTSVVQFGDERWLRAYGGLPHPNVLGGYLVVALAVGCQRLLRVAKGYERLLLRAMVPVLLTGIFFSFSRVAWLAAAVIFVGLIRPRGQIRQIGLIGVILAGWMAVLSVIYWPLFATRLNLKSAERLEVKARVERVEGVREAWEIIKKHPVVGVGIGNYTQSVARELRPNRPLWSYQPVHSVPLLVWAELGTIGLVLFVGLLWKVATHIRGRSLTPTVASGLGMTMGVLLLFDHYLGSLLFGVLLFWPVLGLFAHNPQEPPLTKIRPCSSIVENG